MRRETDSPRVLSDGRYELGERLGAGGYGAVFEARDHALQRQVAIKVFDPKQTGRSRELEDRFRREAVATAAIRHPNVVTVFDVGTENGRIFIVMELLTGRPLTKELERWPHGMPATRALPLLVAALDGLATGHEAGIIHKDLKPSNLFLVKPGDPQEKLAIIDFGVARLVHEQKLTATGKLVGTPRYLAPEYIEDLKVTTALDVYQMGLITVELLCGMPCLPRKLDLVTCCQRHVNGDLEIPDGLREGAIGAVIARATAVDPADRFETAAEFAAALGAVNPDNVKIRTATGHLPTPRLGIKPLTKPNVNTRPLHGGRELLEAQRASSLSKEPARRSTRTGPTRRLGPAKEIADQLARFDEEERIPTKPALPDADIGAETDTAPEPGPDFVFADDVGFDAPMHAMSRPDPTRPVASGDDPLAERKRTIYILLLIALVSVTATATFFAIQFARESADAIAKPDEPATTE